MKKLTMKGAPFVWTAEWEPCFQTLKDKLFNGPIFNGLA
jgi:hypothetical protein